MSTLPVSTTIASSRSPSLLQLQIVLGVTLRISASLFEERTVFVSFVFKDFVGFGFQFGVRQALNSNSLRLWASALGRLSGGADAEVVVCVAVVV